MDKFRVYKNKPKPEYRVCAPCLKTLPYTLEFFGPTKKAKWGLDTICRDCKRFRGGNLPEGCIGISREEGVRNRYTLPCEICNRKTKRMAIDHCHKTGQYRGILCMRCNMSIGHFEDSPELLKLAAKYLEDHGYEVQANST